MRVMILPGTNMCAREISDSLSTMKGVELIGAGFDSIVARDFPFLEFYELPDIKNAETALRSLENLLMETKVDYLYLAHDQWIYELRNFEFIARVKIIKHNSEAIQIASFKSKTYERFKKIIKVPEIFNMHEVTQFPIFGKPNRGQGSRGTKLIQNFTELVNFVEEIKDNYVLSEYLPGEEFTVDCFSDRQGKLIFSSARLRTLVSNGLAIGTKTFFDSALTEMAASISEELALAGAWFFQVKLDNSGLPTLMEIGLRIAGASGVQRTRGMNLSAAWLFQVAGEEISMAVGEIQSEVTVKKTTKYLRYDRDFRKVYVDLDDTLILPDGELNLSLINVLREAKNQGIELTLITRHQGELDSTLSKAGLNELFHNLVWVTDASRKSSKIEGHENFLFIDDSFRERAEVLNAFPNTAICIDQTAFINIRLQI